MKAPAADLRAAVAGGMRQIARNAIQAQQEVSTTKTEHEARIEFAHYFLDLQASLKREGEGAKADKHQEWENSGMYCVFVGGSNFGGPNWSLVLGAGRAFWARWLRGVEHLHIEPQRLAVLQPLAFGFCADAHQGPVVVAIGDDVHASCGNRLSKKVGTEDDGLIAGDVAASFSRLKLCNQLINCHGAILWFVVDAADGEFDTRHKGSLKSGQMMICDQIAMEISVPFERSLGETISFEASPMGAALFDRSRLGNAENGLPGLVGLDHGAHVRQTLLQGKGHQCIGLVLFSG